MSRFEKFQRIRVLNKENEPITEQILIHDCIINFENGYISNWYNESEKETYPAVDCIDAHIEYWENGKLIKTEKYYQKHSIEENSKVGTEAENNFAKYLNENDIPFIHLDQSPKELYSKVFRGKNIKRPDYIIFMGEKQLFIDVKAKAADCYTLNEDELKRLNALKNEYSIDVLFAIIDRDEIESNEFYFLALDAMTDYAEISESKPNKDGKKIYTIPKELLNTGMESKKIGRDVFLKIICDKKRQFRENKYHYSDALQEHLKTENYKWCRMSDNGSDQTYQPFPIKP
jgi:hypothetical protein